MSEIKVGIVANPISARDIRRIVSYAGNLTINDRANIVLRILAGLAKVGVNKAVIMPENGGIRTQLMRTITREKVNKTVDFPEIEYLKMPITASSEDSFVATRLLREKKVDVIAVLGGDGTHRCVVSECGKIPISGTSTGTNNAFPETREPTVTGLGIGLAATGKVPAEIAFSQNKWIEVYKNGVKEIALVDVAIVTEAFVGARAIWKTDNFRDLFVTFGEPQGIGMSSIMGLLHPISRSDSFGGRVELSNSADASFSITSPIAPGLIRNVGIKSFEKMEQNKKYLPSVNSGSIALDGEREITFNEKDEVYVILKKDAFKTINVPACMNYAANHGTFKT
ncbi:MAG: acetoin catabolism protein X [Woeseia sp.]|nr:acetoin catabolism protein X [Woeseia sp.]